MIAKDFPAPGQPVAGIVVLKQARSLIALGHEIKVVRVVPRAPGWLPKWRDYRAIPKRYTFEGVSVESIRAVFPPRMLAMEYLPIQVDRVLRRVVEQFEPNVIHAHCLIPSGQLAVRYGVPSMVTAHGSDAYDWPWRRSGLRRAAVAGVKGASTVVAVSNFIRETVLKLVDRSVEVVFNGADESVFAPVEQAAAREELGISGNRFVITSAGRPPRPKGMFDLIEAAAMLSDRKPLVLLAGPGSTESELTRFAADRGVETRLLGLLTQPELARLIAAADVFALPSYREGLPLVVCEAMLSGRPVVATPAGGIPEIVTEGVHGFLVPPGAVTDLAARLDRLAGDSALAQRLGGNAYEFAKANLTWTANAKRYEELYRSLLCAA